MVSTVEYATHKWEFEFKGNIVTFEVWLPLDLSKEDVEEIFGKLKERMMAGVMPQE